MDIRNYKILNLVFILFMLSACATNEVTDSYNLDNNQNEGIVIVSVSHDKKTGTVGAKGIFYIDSQTHKDRDIKLTSTKQKYPGGWNLKSEFDDSYGRLFVFVLPKGQHKITGWRISNGTGHFSSAEDKTEPLIFNIKGGEIRYLGNLHINFKVTKNFLSVDVVESGYPEIKNKSQRDIAVFEKRYPKYKGKAVIQPLVLGPWVTLDAIIMKNR